MICYVILPLDRHELISSQKHTVMVGGLSGSNCDTKSKKNTLEKGAVTAVQFISKDILF